MKTVIDNVLPPDFIFMMGQYVNICSHIERTCWFILSNLEQTDWTDVTAVSNLVAVRKKTPDLIKALRKKRKDVPAAIANRLEWCLDQIELGLERRHMAIHGAWSTGSAPNTFRVDYFLNTGTRSAPTWTAFFKTDFDMVELQEVVRDADRILQQTAQINNELLALKA